MNNTFFSFKRFWLLLRNDILINYKSYLFSIIGAFVVMFLILYIRMPKQASESIIMNSAGTYHTYIFNHDKYTETFLTTIIALGVFIGLAFPQFNNKVSTSSYLLTPTSTFEKFTSQFLIRVVGGLFLFVFIFWMAAHLSRLLALFNFEGNSENAIETFQLNRLLNYKLDVKTFTILFIGSIGFFLFSARLYFNKLAFLKSILAIPIIILLIYFLLVGFSHLFFPGMAHFFSLYPNLAVQSFPTSNFDSFEIWLICIFSTIILFIVPLGYYKLKEKQL